MLLEQKRVGHVTQLGEAQVAHLAGKASELQAQVWIGGERVAQVTQLGEAQAANLSQQAGVDMNEAEENRARPFNCD